MSLFERDNEGEPLQFPTEPAFLVPVKIQAARKYGHDQKGVFAAAFIPAGTKFWAWTDRVKKIHYTDLQAYIAKTCDSDKDIRVFLRQGFVLPQDDENFFSNPMDAGRFMNHSSRPTCGPDGALCDMKEGEELTMDYSFHGDRYRDICREYSVQTEAEIARTHC